MQMHGFLSRDGINPLELLRVARNQLEPYDTVEIQHLFVTDAECLEAGFAALLSDGSRVTARKMLLATGVVDVLPPQEGFSECLGVSIFHCPYCDGWEVRDRPLAIYGQADRGFGLTLNLLGWSRDLALCTDGPATLSDDERATLAFYHIPVYEESISRLESRHGKLEAIVFENGERLPRQALFFNTGQFQRSTLPERLGCAITEQKSVEVNPLEMTNVRGLYLAGDASRDVQMAIVAAAEGATAAFAINTALSDEDRQLDTASPPRVAATGA
jgi:thioredoxin reductase